MRELEITKKVKVIEQLKSQLLSDVASLFTNMTSDDMGVESSTDILADIVIISYFLTEKLGTSYDGLDLKMKNKLKMALLKEDENSQWRNQLLMLSKFFDAH
ncbi:MAG: MazG-like family protein [Vallitaleaceae bacterium]|nr:MazG-like family protein [Vallitaleaceae bacterium]